MNLTITGVHTETGAALKLHAEAKVADLAHHFEKINDVHITFVQEAPHHIHDAVLNVQANGIVLRAEGRGIDFYAALDEATAKLVRQLERYKGRLNKHRERRAKFKEQMKDLGPLAMFEEAVVEEEVLEGVPEDIFAEFAPDIAKKEVSRVAPMSVDEAVMQMDLLHKPAFLFLNAQTGVLNMVYREGDNSIRWVAPK